MLKLSVIVLVTITYFISLRFDCSVSHYVEFSIKKDIRSGSDATDRNEMVTLANVTTTNPFAGRNNESDFSWLDDAIRDVAYYLRSHKFNDYDRRYETNPERAHRKNYAAFPQPPLRSLHWEVHKYCEYSFLSCIDYLRKRVRNTGLRRSDDTSVVIQEQHWTRKNNSEQIKTVDDECKKMYQTDDSLADPFQGPIERFQWRVTASYYMCWYTMNGVPDLMGIDDTCDNFANCLSPKFGSNNLDPRANNINSYSCALYSFCPDPCCPIKHLDRMDKCWNRAENPCFQANPAGQRICALNPEQNTNFKDIVLNRWNVTCTCPLSGYVWSSLYGICIDVDECSTASLHKCNRIREACVNIPGGYTCACKWGYIWNPIKEQCEVSDTLAVIKKQIRKNNEKHKNKKATSIVKRIIKFFRKSNSAMTIGRNEIHVKFSVIVISIISFNLLN